MNPENIIEIGTSLSSLDDVTDEKDVDNAVLKTLNDLIVLLDVNHPRVSSLMYISSAVYPALFQKIFGYQAPDLIVTPKTMEDEAHNIQCVIDTLSLDILGVSLSHITGEDILARKSLPIHHLLDLISEFVKIRQYQPSRTSGSVSVPVLIDSSASSSNASHQEHFCPACDSCSTKSSPVSEETVSTCNAQSRSSVSLPSVGSQPVDIKNGESSLISTRSTSGVSYSSIDNVLPATSLANTSTILSSTSGKSSTTSEIPRSSSTSRGIARARKSIKDRTTFNEKLAQKLVHNLDEMKKKLVTDAGTSGLQSQSPSPMEELYKSVFQRSMRKTVHTPSKETSVLLPRYLKRRRSIVRMKGTPSKRQKCHSSDREKGILEEIKSNVPGVRFTQDGLFNLGLDHKRQVRFLSSHLTALKNKVSASEKMLNENILKQVQLADIQVKDKEDSERLRDVKSLRNERLKTVGAIKNKSIQRARTKRYYDEFHIKHHQKLSSRKAREETLLRDLYKHRLAIQKQQEIDLSNDLRKQERDEATSLENRLASVQNFYLGKSELQKEKALEQQSQRETQIKAQYQVLEETRKAIMKQIENEVKEIQENLERQDDFHFVQSDAERLKEKWSRPNK